MTPDQLKAWFQWVHPGWVWDNRCAGAMYQVCVATGGEVHPYATATDAYRASRIESMDPTAAPPGAFHHWSYWATLGGVYANYGHVACEMTGTGWALMSNPEAGEADWGITLGVTNVAAWTKRRRGIVTYLGWSYTYGVNDADIINPAASGKEPPTPTEEDEIMGAQDTILAAIAAVGAEAAANTARLRLEIRGHIFYDAGPAGDQPFSSTKHAALINGAGRIIVMNADPVGQEASWRQDHYKFTDASRTAEANRVALNTAAFWNKVKDELTARSDDFYTVADAQVWFAKRQAQIAAADAQPKSVS